jgi:hypothetical protein
MLPDEMVFNHFRAELEPGVLRVLHAGFGQNWGDSAFWRWKHSSRPGFSPLDVAVVTQSDKPVACFHLAVRSMRMGPGLTLRCSVEGDFAVEPGVRGRGLPKQGYRVTSGTLVERSVVLRAGFSSVELFEHVYKPNFGHRMMPTVTAQYRKILSDRALRERLRHVGNQLRLRPRMQRLLEQAPLTVRLEISGFQPCDLVLTRDSASCTDNLARRPDLRIRAPYLLLAASRMRRLPAMCAFVRAFLSGQARVRGLVRVLGRFVAPPARI